MALKKQVVPLTGRQIVHRATGMLLIAGAGQAFMVGPAVWRLRANIIQRCQRYHPLCRNVPLTSTSHSIPQDYELHWLEPSSSGLDDMSGGRYAGWDDDDDVLFGDDDDEDNDLPERNSLGRAIGEGKLVICLTDIASSQECRTLFQAGVRAAQSQATLSATTTRRGRSRFSVADPAVFDSKIALMAEQILLRVLDFIDESIPSIYTWLFDPTSSPGQWMKRQPLNAMLEQPNTPPDAFLGEACSGLRDLYMMGALEWSEGEPAINIYTSAGYFGCHKDHLALTILIPLTNVGEDFEGGGTGFWAGNRGIDENPSQIEPDLVLTPSMGSALLFGGDVTHAGMAVDTGCRGVLVCSLSTQTPASSPDRLHGLQAPPKVSANFKGTA